MDAGAFLMNCVLTGGVLADMTVPMQQPTHVRPKQIIVRHKAVAGIAGRFFHGRKAAPSSIAVHSCRNRLAIDSVSKPTGRPASIQPYPSPAEQTCDVKQFRILPTVGFHRLVSRPARVFPTRGAGTCPFRFLVFRPHVADAA